MSTSRSTENHLEETQSENILILGYDVDDCTHPPNLPKPSALSTKVSIAEWIINFNLSHLKKQVSDIKHMIASTPNSVKWKIILCLISSRQSNRIDLFNAENHYSSQSSADYPYKVFGRCTATLPAFQSYFAHELADTNCEILFDMATKADFDFGQPAGTTYKQMLENTAEITAYHYDEYKISLLQAIMSKHANLFPHASLFFRFFEDREDIIHHNYITFSSRHFRLLPQNVRKIQFIHCLEGKVSSDKSFTIDLKPGKELVPLQPIHYLHLNFFLQSINHYYQEQYKASRLESKAYLERASTSHARLDLEIGSTVRNQELMLRERTKLKLKISAEQAKMFCATHPSKITLTSELLRENAGLITHFMREELPKIDTPPCIGCEQSFTTAKALLEKNLIPTDWLYSAPAQPSIAVNNIFTQHNTRQVEQERSQQSSAPLPECCI